MIVSEAPYSSRRARLAGSACAVSTRKGMEWSEPPTLRLMRSNFSPSSPGISRSHNTMSGEVDSSSLSPSIPSFDHAIEEPGSFERSTDFGALTLRIFDDENAAHWKPIPLHAASQYPSGSQTRKARSLCSDSADRARTACRSPARTATRAAHRRGDPPLPAREGSRRSESISNPRSGRPATMDT